MPTGPSDPVGGAVTWLAFEAADPEAAAHARARLGSSICYLATVRPDGWPRVHPVGVRFRDAGAYLSMLPGSPKGQDLVRNGRYGLHCTVEDATGGGGEVMLRGVARSAPPSQPDEGRGWISFELLVLEVLLTRYDQAQARPETRRWRPTNPGTTPWT